MAKAQKEVDLDLPIDANDKSAWWSENYRFPAILWPNPNFLVGIAPLAAPNLDVLACYMDRALRAGFSLVEVRLDSLESLNLDTYSARCELKKVLAKFPAARILLTWRGVVDTGGREIPGAAYEEILLDLAPAAGYVDVETNYEKSASIIAQLHSKGVRVVASYHDFTDTPPLWRQLRIFNRQVELGADVLKVATMAGDELVSGILQAAQTARAQKLASLLYPAHPIIAVAMGDAGSIHRLGGYLGGNSANFYLLAGAEETAKGQVSWEKAQEIYAQKRCRKKPSRLMAAGMEVTQMQQERPSSYWSLRRRMAAFFSVLIKNIML